MELYKVGSRGEMVKRIQQVVKAYPDGIFGDLTKEAVKAWQREHGLARDGIVGVKTLAKMFPTMAGWKKSKRSIALILVHCTATAEGKDYTVTYKNNVNTGTATATIQGIGNYSGTASVSFTILEQSFFERVISAISTFFTIIITWLQALFSF